MLINTVPFPAFLKKTADTTLYTADSTRSIATGNKLLDKFILFNNQLAVEKLRRNL